MMSPAAVERDWSALRIAYVFTGSYCTLDKSLAALVQLGARGVRLLPVFSFSVSQWDSRFGTAAEWRQRVEEVCGQPVLDTLSLVEPIGPHKMADILVVAPCSGNTIAKLAAGITDTPALMAVKSHLRIDRPVVLALASNDALSANAANIGQLLNRKHIYFVPFYQDDPVNKPHSLTADLRLLMDTLDQALAGRQLQPLLARV